MGDTIRALKGMNDLFEDELATWRHVEEQARQTFLAFGFGEIRTPVLEELALFVRSVGEGTDIVEKEMYAFSDTDKKQTKVCLRPENTAGVVRALIQAGKLPADAEARVFYLGPMFRRERPQKGRYRQFHQLGAEAFGLTAPSVDVEMMAMLHAFGQRLGLSGVRLVINSLGDPADRARYLEALVAYLTPHQDRLSEDSRRRLAKNPLRILDAKDEGDRAIVQDAPRPLDFLGDEARAHFDEVRRGLELLGVPYDVDPSLVRGLDYYTRTVFELLADTGLGAQNAVAAGGRYDHLVEELGGRSTPGIGFAAGIERIVLLLDQAGATTRPDVFLIAADDGGRDQVLQLAMALRERGLGVEIDHRGRSVKAQMKRADKSGARFAMVVGQREIEAAAADLKNLQDGSVRSLALEAGVIEQATHTS